MTKVRIFILMICCFPLWGGIVSADDFNPDNPAEPAAIDYCRLTVSADPAEGADVSGGGKYLVNGSGSVYVSTNARNTTDYEYIFQYWTENGVRTAYSQSFYYTPKKGTFNLVAHYLKKEVVFDPEDPLEPSQSTIKKKYYLTLTSSIEGACSFSMASGNKIEEGSIVSLDAYMNNGYKFEYWKLNGTKISSSSWVSFNMPSQHSTLEAVVSEIPFDPDNPTEPNGTGNGVDNATRKLIDIYVGSTTNDKVDRTRIAFNEESSLEYEIGKDVSKTLSGTADYQIYSLDSKATKYAINERPVGTGEVPLGIVVKEGGTVKLTVTRQDCSIALIDKVLGITRDMAWGSYSFTAAAGTTIENRFVLTTNIPDLILGDASGDGKVDMNDALLILDYLMGNPPAGFNLAAADVNGDGKVGIADAVSVVNILMNQ